MSRYAESRVLDTRLEQTAALTRRLRQAQALRLEQIGGRLDTASSRLEERFARQFEGWSASWNATICGFADSTRKGRWSGAMPMLLRRTAISSAAFGMCSPAHP